MLEFCEEFMGRIMRRKTFRAKEMDTDSLTENSLYEYFIDNAKAQVKEIFKCYRTPKDCYQPNAN